MKLIVGLGNPGKDYEKTRHNVGFMVLDKIKESYKESKWSKKFDGFYFGELINGEKILFFQQKK